MKNQSECKAAILESLKDGATWISACEKADVGRVTAYLWKNEDPKFKADVEEAQSSRVQLVIDSLYREAIQGNIAACIFYLKNRAGWKDIPTVEINQEFINQDIQIVTDVKQESEFKRFLN